MNIIYLGLMYIVLFYLKAYILSILKIFDEKENVINIIFFSIIANAKPNFKL